MKYISVNYFVYKITDKNRSCCYGLANVKDDSRAFYRQEAEIRAGSLFRRQ